MRFLHPNSDGEGARRWARVFAWVSRLNYIRNQTHDCRPTCFKDRSDDAVGFRVCRYGYQNEFHVCDYGKNSADEICNTKTCCRVGDVLKTNACGKKEMVHPNLCPAVGTVTKNDYDGGECYVCLECRFVAPME